MKMTQDELYKYLTEHDVKVSRIAELMGVIPQMVISCFRHNKNHNGNPRYFSVESIGKLNDALPKLAIQLRQCVMTFGTDKMYSNKYGRTYDPGMIEQFNYLGELMNLTNLVKRILGWSRSKKNSVFCSPKSKAYGNITKDDVTKVNAEILAVAGVLEGVEVVPDVNAFDGYGSSSEPKEE